MTTNMISVGLALSPGAIALQICGIPIAATTSPVALPLGLAVGSVCLACLVMRSSSHGGNNTREDRETPGSSSDPPPESTNGLPLSHTLLVSKRKFKELLEKYGERMYQKMGQKIKPNAQNGKICDEGGFRVDMGYKHKGGGRNYEIQVNKPDDRSSTLAKSMLRDLKGDSHKKVYRGVWDMNNPPTLGEWRTVFKSDF